MCECRYNGHLPLYKADERGHYYFFNADLSPLILFLQDYDTSSLLPLDSPPPLPPPLQQSQRNPHPLFHQKPAVVCLFWNTHVNHLASMHAFSLVRRIVISQAHLRKTVYHDYNHFSAVMDVVTTGRYLSPSQSWFVIIIIFNTE